MTVRESVACAASTMTSRVADADPGAARRDRRRLRPRGRTWRSSDRVPRRPPMGRVTPAEAPGESWDEPAQGAEDGLDPAFDEIGEVHDHIDGLGSWMRLGRAHPGRRGD